MRKLPSLRKPDPEPAPSQEPAPPEKRAPAKARGPRLSIKMMMMLTLVMAVAAAAYGGMRREGADRAFYVMFATAAPLVVLVIAGIVHQLLHKRR